MRVVGLISGTSHDGIDAAAVDFAVDGDVLTAQIVETSTTAYTDSLRQRIAAALPPAATTLEEVCALDADIGNAFAHVAAQMIDRLPGRYADAVCSAGQTVYHGVDDGRAWGTLQLGQPAWIAELTGVPVVSDLRGRDIAAGGQGAPLVSMLDTLLFADSPATVAILNVGGIANVTLLGRGRPPLAFDIGPGNALIDALVVRQTSGAFSHDVDGNIAASGNVIPDVVRELLADPYYRLPPPKTTGKERFNATYLDSHVPALARIHTADAVATVTAAAAQSVAEAIQDEEAELVVVSGGGARNPVFMAELRHRLGVPLVRSDEHGLPSDGKEAIAFALIGWLTLHGLPATIPGCTGAGSARVLGSITPGGAPLRLPDPLDQPPRKLTITPEP